MIEKISKTKGLPIKSGAILFSALILAGCGSSAAKAPTASAPKSGTAATSSQSSAPQKLQTVTFGTPDATDLALIELYLARDLGIFKKYGIQPKFEVMHPPEAIAALANGNLDFMTPVDATATAAEKGLPLRIVAIVEDNAEFLLLGAKGVTNVSQLKGQTVVTGTTKGNSNYLMIVDALNKVGVPPSSYKTDFASSTVTVALLQKHEAAAGMETEPIGLQLKQEGYPLLLNLMSEHVPGIGLGTSKSVMQKNPQLVRNVIKAMLEATKILATDKAKVLPYLEKDYNMSPSIASQVYDLNKGNWILSGKATMAAEERMMQFDQKELKSKTVPNPNQVFDYSFLPKSSASASASQ